MLVASLAKLCDTLAMRTPIQLRVKTKLNARRGDWPAISEQSGVSYSWIEKFANGRIPNPGVLTLEKIESVFPRRSKAKAEA